MKEQTKARDMTPLEIRKALLDAHGGLGAQAVIARRKKVDRSTVSKVVDGAPSDSIRRAIAEYAGIDVKIIWPSIYLYGGGPRKRGRPFAEDNRKRATA